MERSERADKRVDLVKRKPAKRRRRTFARSGKLKFIISALIVLPLGWIGYVLWLTYSADNIGLDKKADVGIVLGAALWGKEPSPALKERLNRAAELYRAGHFATMIVSGGFDYAGAPLSEAEGMRNYLIRQGIPERAIVLEDKATTTYENIVFSSKLMEQHNWSRAIIVTHRYHGARAMDIARFVGMNDPALAVADTEVLSMWWHRGRETLAFTKWQLDKFRMTFPSIAGNQ